MLELLVGFTILFILGTVIGAVFLWVGMKVAAIAYGMPAGGVYCSYAELLVVVAAASATSIIPYVGTLGSFVVLFLLLKKYTSAGVGDLV